MLLHVCATTQAFLRRIIRRDSRLQRLSVSRQPSAVNNSNSNSNKRQQTTTTKATIRLQQQQQQTKYGSREESA